MVDTMASLRAFLRATRTERNTPPSPRLAAAGLPADDEVLLDAPDARLGPALVAAGRGEYGPASELLAATRVTGEWDNRDRYVIRLAAFAHSRAEWLTSWRAAAPQDPDALLIAAELAVATAWESPARAELLLQTGPLVDAAAAGDPRDPVPWRIALDRARGSDAEHGEFERLWAEAVRRSAHHYGCHVAALQYLSTGPFRSPRGHGSYHECFDFAERAAQDALPGTLVQALPLHAAFICLTEGDGRTMVDRHRLDAAADTALALSATYPAADPWPAELRNLLTYVLIALGRWQDALLQLRLTGPYTTSFPWDRFSDDPLGSFLEAREEIHRNAPAARCTACAAHPPSEHGGRAHSGDH
ncbi:hypothetical protein [Streptomyces turgidiscabies]|uniref:DUF4034 domain-containing protein n=1 Tax=Streptomyces turgidiscabies TaxID=85558 RepID=A0ABU0RI50_9ACTN|nr:hypothetical protein [Streptomyces turgidiscabies]MDQ0931662.1 hypothetical protein [Streptomyces turgidiscabies]